MSFLEQLELLRLRQPRLYNINLGSENSDYCTHSDKNKNCYLLFAANFNQDCMYGGLVLTSRDCVDCNYCEYSELCYESVDINHCYNCNFCQDMKNCTDCAFCYECVGCQNCFGCANLRQKQHCFFNEQLSKESFDRSTTCPEPVEGGSRRAELRMTFIKQYKNGQPPQEFTELKEKSPRKAAHLSKCENCVGEFIGSSKNCFSCFDAYECQDCYYLQDCWRTKDSADMTFSDGSELCYEGFSIGLNTYNCNFCNYVRSCSDCEYCELLFSCKHCFGCVGLQNKEYCILNKPYPREEYLEKVEEIKAEMKRNQEYGKQLATTYKYEDTAAMWWK